MIQTAPTTNPLCEVAGILAAGILRLRCRTQANISGKDTAAARGNAASTNEGAYSAEIGENR